MRRSTLVLAMTLLGCLLPTALFAQNQKDNPPGQSPAVIRLPLPSGVVNPLNPPHMQGNLTMPSGFVMSLLALQKQGLTSPHIQALEKRFGLTPNPPSSGTPLKQAASLPGPPAPICSTQAGVRFNLEPPGGSPGLNFVVPQDETPVDFIPGGGVGGSDLVIGGANDYRGIFEGFISGSLAGTWGFNATGYYVHRSGNPNDCSTSFEGSLPHLTDPFTAGPSYGAGDPVPFVDSTRGNVYMADLRFSNKATAVGLFRTTAANMNNPAVCAPGTHLLDAAGNETAASTCWPTGIMVAPEDQFASNFPLHDKPHARADERPDSACNGSAGTGSGCGDIYVTWTEFTFSGGSSASTISLAVCRNTFTTSADCSSPITISAPSDTSTQFSHIAARPDGVVSVTYANTTGNFFNPGPTTAINYVSCVPGAHSVGSVPPPPTCAAPVLVTAETQPHPQGYFLYNQAFPTATYPTHDNRLNGGTWEEIVAWERCKVPEGVVVGSPFSGLIICPDDDIRMAIAPVDGNGVPTGAWAISDVNTSPGNQIFPWVKANHDTNAVQITYITSENDPQVYTFQLQRNTVKSNHETAGNSEVLSKTAFAPADDPWLVGGFIGDYIGMATKGNTSYFHYTGTNFQGLANGVSIFEDNNQLIKKSD